LKHQSPSLCLLPSLLLSPTSRKRASCLGTTRFAAGPCLAASTACYNEKASGVGRWRINSLPAACKSLFGGLWLSPSRRTLARRRLVAIKKNVSGFPRPRGTKRSFFFLVCAANTEAVIENGRRSPNCAADGRSPLSVPERERDGDCVCLCVRETDMHSLSLSLSVCLWEEIPVPNGTRTNFERFESFIAAYDKFPV